MVLGKGDFDQLLALSSHRKSLRQKQEQIRKLLLNIDKTINHIKGKKLMKDLEMFDGFNLSLVNKAPKGTPYYHAEEIVLKSVRNPTKNIEELKERGGKMLEMAHAVFQELSNLIEKGLDPSSLEVQIVIKRHHYYTNEIHNATRDVYKALAELYREHPDFKKQLDPFHPRLSQFMSEAMIHFSN